MNGTYIDVLKEKNWNWKKVILAIGLYIVLIAISFFVLKKLMGIEQYLIGTKGSDIFSEQVLNIFLFSWFPIGLFINWIVFKSSPGNLMSVAGKVRWKWLFHCIIVMLPIMTTVIIIQNFIEEPVSLTFNMSTLTAVAISFIFTPLQCMGEEMLFRGWAIQTFGPFFKNKKTGWIVIGLLASAAFSLAHNPSTFLIGIELFAFALISCVLIYVTGGMEACIVMHAINNVVLFSITNLSGGAVEFLANSSNPGSWTGTVASIACDIVFLFIFIYLWKRFQKREKENLV